MSRSIILSGLFIIAAICGTTAQEACLTVNSNIRLPEDSIESAQLVADLNDFLIAVRQPGAENKRILPSENMETKLLTDEMTDKNDSTDFKPYLINVESLEDENACLLQISYMGVNNGEPILRSVFKLIARKTDTGFLFSSPLSENTKDWKTKIIGHLTFHCQDDSSEEAMNRWANTAIEFDRKLNADAPMDFYFCSDCKSIMSVLSLTGIDYKSEFNGTDNEVMVFDVENKRFVFVPRQILQHTGAHDLFHDLFHWRANTVTPQDTRNYYMVCGGAPAYEGSWGFSREEIQKIFKTEMIYDRKTDWLKLYFERYCFGKRFRLTQFINALIIRKTEREQGFSAVMELLASGNMDDRENFFGILAKVTGINEKNFNGEVAKLIDDAMKIIDKK